jgi:hypothetical protein
MSTSSTGLLIDLFIDIIRGALDLRFNFTCVDEILCILPDILRITHGFHERAQ